MSARTKRADEMKSGDVMVWAGSLAGAVALYDWDGKGFQIRWDSSLDVPSHTTYLTWAPDTLVNLEERP